MGSCPLSYSRRMSSTFRLSSLQSVNNPGTCACAGRTIHLWAVPNLTDCHGPAWQDSTAAD